MGFRVFKIRYGVAFQSALDCVQRGVEFLPMFDDWITTEEAVSLSGYNMLHLRRLIREGKVQGQKFGRTWMVDKNSLLDYLEKAKQSDDKRWGPKQ